MRFSHRCDIGVLVGPIWIARVHVEMHVDGPPEQSGSVSLSTGLFRNEFAGQ
jgi:hypothetical protein